MKFKKIPNISVSGRRVKGSLKVVIITGLSGSGKTVALRALEDSAFFCIDNLPISLIDSLLTKTSVSTKIKNIAIGIDIRENFFLSDTVTVLNFLRKKHQIEILFLEAEPEVLIRRFKETRRPHPLGGDLAESIKSERSYLSALREKADRILDTSSLSPHQLRNIVSSLYFPKGSINDLSVNLISFGFKYGVPQNIDLLFDVRFLPNPNFVPSLKHLNGKNKKVAKYVFSKPETKEFIEKIKNLLDFLIPLYIKEGRSYLAIGVGCTGGNHRSPAIIEEIYRLIKIENVDLSIIHRDIS